MTGRLLWVASRGLFGFLGLTTPKTSGERCRPSRGGGALIRPHQIFPTLPIPLLS